MDISNDLAFFGALAVIREGTFDGMELLKTVLVLDIEENMLKAEWFESGQWEKILPALCQGIGMDTEDIHLPHVCYSGNDSILPPHLSVAYPIFIPRRLAEFCGPLEAFLSALLPGNEMELVGAQATLFGFVKKCGWNTSLWELLDVVSEKRAEIERRIPEMIAYGHSENR